MPRGWEDADTRVEEGDRFGRLYLFLFVLFCGLSCAAIIGVFLYG